MLKFLMIGALVFVLYRFIKGPQRLNEPNVDERKLNDEGDFADYEEVE